MVELQNVVKPVLVIAKLFMNKRMKLQMQAALDFCSQKLYFVKLERAVFFVLLPISWTLRLHSLVARLKLGRAESAATAAAGTT